MEMTFHSIHYSLTQLLKIVLSFRITKMRSAEDRPVQNEFLNIVPSHQTSTTLLHMWHKIRNHDGEFLKMNNTKQFNFTYFQVGRGVQETISYINSSLDVV
ncbi:uncharacterized protein ACOB8E_001831 [Sarcophilus harrisii]